MLQGIISSPFVDLTMRMKSHHSVHISSRFNRKKNVRWGSKRGVRTSTSPWVSPSNLSFPWFGSSPMVDFILKARFRLMLLVQTHHPIRVHENPGWRIISRRDGCDHCGLKRAILTSDPADTMTAYSIERAKQQWYKAVEYAPIDEEERLPMILDHIDLWTNVSESSGTKIPIHHGQEYLDNDDKVTMVQPIVLFTVWHTH